jgi:hypothetical protein
MMTDSGGPKTYGSYGSNPDPQHWLEIDLPYLFLFYLWGDSSLLLVVFTIVADPLHFGVDPDPDLRIHASD